VHDPSLEDTIELTLPMLAAAESGPQPASSGVRVEFGAASHVGKRRSNNEDAYLIFRTGRYLETVASSLPRNELPRRFDEQGYTMVVADGMGGHAAGEVASQTAIRSVVSCVLNAVKWALKLDHPEAREQEIREAKARALDYVRRIDDEIRRLGRGDAGLKGMGTTLTACYSFGRDLFVVHVGDSRAYLFRGDSLQRLTRDQTMAQAMADAGEISQEEAERHRLRHVLTQALGTGSATGVEISHRELRDGDRVLLCSDGLTDMLDDAGIAAQLLAHPASEPACQALIERALHNGGRDNVTVLVARYTIPAA
jgi:PPM family protein phosphatase